MDQSIPKLEKSDDIDAAIKLVLSEARKKVERGDTEGLAARFACAVVPGFLKTLESARQSMMANGESLGDGEIGVRQEDFDAIGTCVVNTLSHQLALTAMALIPCGSEPDNTCENCVRNRNRFVTSMAQNAVEGAKEHMRATDRKFVAYEAKVGQ